MGRWACRHGSGWYEWAPVLSSEGVESIQREGTPSPPCVRMSWYPPRRHLGFVPVVAGVLRPLVVWPMPRVVRIKVPLGAYAASFEVEESTPGPVAAEDIEILALVGKCDTAYLAEEVKRLLSLEGLRVDDVDEICLLGRHQHPLSGPDRREF